MKKTLWFQYVSKRPVSFLRYLFPVGNVLLMVIGYSVRYLSSPLSDQLTSRKYTKVKLHLGKSELLLEILNLPVPNQNFDIA